MRESSGENQEKINRAKDYLASFVAQSIGRGTQNILQTIDGIDYDVALHLPMEKVGQILDELDKHLASVNAVVATLTAPTPVDGK
jgi:hypothetical protein